MSLNQIIIIHIVRIKGRIIIFSKLTNLLRKINTFRPLTKDEVQTIEKKYDHVWSSNAIEGSSLSKYETAALLETGLTVHGCS